MTLMVKTITLAAALAAFPAVASERELPPNTDPYSMTYLDEARRDVRAEREQERPKRECARSCACLGHSAGGRAPTP